MTAGLAASGRSGGVSPHTPSARPSARGPGFGLRVCLPSHLTLSSTSAVSQPLAQPGALRAPQLLSLQPQPWPGSARSSAHAVDYLVFTLGLWALEVKDLAFDSPAVSFQVTSWVSAHIVDTSE